MKKIISMVTAIVMIMCAVYAAPTSAGAEDALKISTAEELKAFADSVNGGNTYEGKTVTLANDIDLSTVCGPTVGATDMIVSWTPIGGFENPFDGTFDGAGHTVSGLYINAEYLDCAGLFGYCGEGSQILDLVVDGSVTVGYPSSGEWAQPPIWIGGISGGSAGKIENCHNKVSINGIGNGAFAGGICSLISEHSRIDKCINTGVIASEGRLGAVVSLVYSYSDCLGNCYYLEGTAEDSSGAEAKTAEQFASGEVAYLLGDAWGQRIGVDEYPVIGGDKVYLVDGKYMNVPDSRYGRIVGKCHPAGATLKLYKGTNDAIAETIADSNGNYAFENLEPGNNYAISCDKTGYLPTRLEKLVVIAGETTEANISTSVGDSTIVISNAQELKDFADRVNSGKIYTAYKYDIVLENDIDLSEICGEDINGESVSWIPIGTPEHPFTGYFNGDNHTISGLYIDWEASNADELTNYRGLFGYAGAGSSIYDLTLEGTVNGGATIFWQRPSASSKFLYIGSIAGYSEGNLINCHNNAKVAYIGNYGCAGGIIGTVSGDGAYIKDCSNIADVEKSFDNCGGIAGNVENHASVTDCWCTCESMIGAFNVIDTENGASVTDCYYLADADNGKGGKTAEQFASGEVAYLLGDAWGQRIGVDEYPVIGGKRVYSVGGGYGNSFYAGSWKKYTSVEELPETTGEYAKYDEEFFKHYFLVELHTNMPSSGDTVDLLYTDTSGSTIDIAYMHKACGFGPDDVGLWTKLIEIDRANIDKEINVRHFYDEWTNTESTEYYAGGFNIVSAQPSYPNAKPIIFKVDSLEKLKEDYIGENKEEVISRYSKAFDYGGYLLVVQWVEPSAVRTHEIGSVYYDLTDDSSPVTASLQSMKTPDEDYQTIPTTYCAITRINGTGLEGRDLTSRNFVLDYDDPPKKVVTVEPPKVSHESGVLLPGTKVTISPTDGNGFCYKVNGGDWINPLVTYQTHDVTLTITEDTTLVVKSYIDAVEKDTEYIFPEATYTYTVDGCVIPPEYPYVINSVKLVSESGEEYHTPPEGKSFIVDVNVKKFENRDNMDYFVVAVYGDDNSLLSLNYIKANLPQGSEFSAGVNIPKSEKRIGEVKAFVWDSFGGMTPLAEEVSLGFVHAAE